jgi:hypothetical protein
MANYVWQLGIDWNAVETAGVSYLRGGLTTEEYQPLPGTNRVQHNDEIIFQIFDVNSSVENPGRQVTAIGSFVILTTAAVTGQVNCNSLSSLQPTITPDESTPQNRLFGNAYCSWTSHNVKVAALPEGVPVGRFLLTIQVQAVGPNGGVRIFRHDPEMVVGPNG